MKYSKRAAVGAFDLRKRAGQLLREAFSLERLRTLSMEEIAKRYETFKLMSQFEVSAA
jgi:hypothetical protein